MGCTDRVVHSQFLLFIYSTLFSARDQSSSFDIAGPSLADHFIVLAPELLNPRLMPRIAEPSSAPLLSPADLSSSYPVLVSLSPPPFVLEFNIIPIAAIVNTMALYIVSFFH